MTTKEQKINEVIEYVEKEAARRNRPPLKMETDAIEKMQATDAGYFERNDDMSVLELLYIFNPES